MFPSARSSGFQPLPDPYASGREEKEEIPTRPTSRAREDVFLLPFPRDNHLCKGIMLQLEEKKEKERRKFGGSIQKTRE